MEDREQLVGNSMEDRLDVPYTGRGSCSLDRNHNFFLLVDDGSVGRFYREIKFRAALERALSQHGGTPIVSIVIQGGPNSIRCVKHCNVVCVLTRSYIF